MLISGHTKTICHKGIVQKSEDNNTLVIINAVTACSGCHSEGTCSLSGKEEKIIEVTGPYNLKPGDEVIVHMKRSMGYTALLLAYLVPLAIILISLIVLISLNLPELTAGLVSVGMLIPYFAILFLFRKQIDNKFIFTLNA
jgi:sigma-E factor negative regulatory protein RseC